MKTTKCRGGHIDARPTSWPHTSSRGAWSNPPSQPRPQAATERCPAAAITPLHGLCPSGIRRRREQRQRARRQRERERSGSGGEAVVERKRGIWIGRGGGGGGI